MSKRPHEENTVLDKEELAVSAQKRAKVDDDALMNPLLPSRPGPLAPALSSLFIVIGMEDIVNSIKYVMFTPTLATDPGLYLELLSHFQETVPYHMSDEHNDGLYLPDILDYLCGDWREERVPEALPASLWFVPREKLGFWKRLGADDYVNVCDGPWKDVITIVDSYTLADGTFTNPNERMVEKSTWEEAVAENV
jgi:hypothetical protein